MTHGLQLIFSERYGDIADSRLTEILFGVLYFMFVMSGRKNTRLFGTPAKFLNVDLSLIDFSEVELEGSRFQDCLIQETNFAKSNLKRSEFANSILERTRFDEAKLQESDFTTAQVVSIHVYDEFESQTSAILGGLKAQQWLFSHGARVTNSDQLNPYLGRPWYHAAREVTKTIKKKMAGTHEQSALSKGTSLKHRGLANDFVQYLCDNDVLQRVMKSRKTDGWVVRLNPDYRADITEFSDSGIISPALRPFFDKRVAELR
jgi:hypothetical protein